MEAKGKKFSKKEFYKIYGAQINWDWLFLKGQLIFGSILLLGMICFILWFTQ